VSSSAESTLFELLKTTKKDGMGLGLWLSKYILTKSGGDIKYLRPEGLGATFQILLPIEFKASQSAGGD
jgi:C4-dicarboxylate-specific signal transduction histidine kinase